MTLKQNLSTKINLIFKEFLADAKNKACYEITDVYECEKTQKLKAAIKLSNRHVIHKYLCDIVIDNDLIDTLPPRVVRAITYLATSEKMAPDCVIISQQMTDEIDEFILEIKSKEGESIKKSASEVSKDLPLLRRLNPVESNRAGYLAGVRETVKEYLLLNRKE